MKALSKGDREILVQMSDGVSDPQICRSLRISPQTLARAVKRIEARASAESEDAGRYYQTALRRRAESRLESLTARFHALMEALPQAVLVIDGRTGAIKDANDLACELFGYSRTQLFSLSVEDLVPAETRTVHPAYRIGFLASVRKREMGYHPPIYGLRSDGTEIEMAIALTATTADDDVMVVCTTRQRWDAARASEAAAQVTLNVEA